MKAVPAGDEDKRKGKGKRKKEGIAGTGMEGPTSEGLPASDALAAKVARPIAVPLLETKGSSFTRSFMAEKLGGGLVDEAFPGAARGLKPSSLDLPAREASGPIPMQRRVEAVIGDDQRSVVGDTSRTPWSSIAHLHSSFARGRSRSGTGFFISPTVLMTAAHVVFSHERNERPWKVVVAPGLGNGFLPFGTFEASAIDIPPPYGSGDRVAWDIALVHLQEDAGSRTGWFGIGQFNDAALHDVLVNVAGYPHDIPGQLCAGSGRIRNVGRTLYHDADTFTGQSGSPVYFRDASGQRIVLGVHSASNDFGPARSAVNEATRVSKDVYGWVQGVLGT